MWNFPIRPISSFSNYEIGYGGNSSIPEDVVEYLAVDMGAIGDGQATDEYTVSICAMDSSDPTTPGLRQHLVDLAEKHDISTRLTFIPSTPLMPALPSGRGMM